MFQLGINLSSMSQYCNNNTLNVDNVSLLCCCLYRLNIYIRFVTLVHHQVKNKEERDCRTNGYAPCRVT